MSRCLLFSHRYQILVVAGSHASGFLAGPLAAGLPCRCGLHAGCPTWPWPWQRQQGLPGHVFSEPAQLATASYVCLFGSLPRLGSGHCRAYVACRRPMHMIRHCLVCPSIGAPCITQGRRTPNTGAAGFAATTTSFSTMPLSNKLALLEGMVPCM